MAVVKRIAPGSAFKVGLVLYAILGLLLGIFAAVISMLAGSLGPALTRAGMPVSGVFGFDMGLVAILFFPIFYGLIGGIFAALGAVMYNLAAGWIGGIEIDLS